ncbi:hypothetical protein [Streptomyces sp. NPDC096153]|uniref:hypothetical protein n=1 Tax=Streptomyces sp. NPDC096153 TaxID=3155548 RepID=UPI0033333AAE
MPSSPNEGERAPEVPKLVTIPEMPALLEAAGLKRVGPARIRQLAAQDDEWPKPVFERGRTRIFDWAAVERYFRRRVTRQGERTDLPPKGTTSNDERSPGGE